MTLFYLAAAWMGGIVLGRQSGLAWWVWLAAAGVVGLAGVVILRGRRRWWLVPGAVMMATLGAARIGLARPAIDEGHLAAYNGSGYVTMEGWVVDMPDVRDRHVNLRVQATAVTLEDGRRHPVVGRALVQAPRPADFRYGDMVEVRGELRTPPEFDGFSYRDYLAREGIHSFVQYVQIEPTGERRGSPVRAVMSNFRRRAHDAIRGLLPDPQASLLAGILLGIESGISEDVRGAFNAVSATHVIAISGANLVILAGVIQRVMMRITTRERVVAGVTISGILTYAIFVGGDAAVIRAAIMTTLALVAGQLGRQTYGPASLGFAALLMSVINPLVLWDVGFQLSFAATLGLVLYVDPLEKGLTAGLQKLFGKEQAQRIVGLLSEAMVVTIAAQITTFPIMLATFERFSPAALAVNLLIVPAQTPLMVLGGVAVLASLVVWPVGQILAWGSWLFLSWTIGVVRVFARMPFASLPVQNISTGAVVVIYGVMLGGTFFMMQREAQRERQIGWLRHLFGVKATAAAGLLTATLLVVGAWQLPDGRLRVTVLDVGDGAATLIITPGGRQILVGAGGSGRDLSAELGDALPFWDRQIDLLVIPEPSERALGGLADILPRYRFEAVLTNGVRGSSDKARNVWEALEAQEAEIITAQPGMRINVGDGVTLTVIATQVGATGDEEVEGIPVTLSVTYGELQILLAGHLTVDEIDEVMGSDYLEGASVLVTPAGGHREANSEAFLRVVDPQMAVISVDAGNRYGLPHVETVDRMAALGVDLYRTDQHGRVMLVSDGEQVWIKTGR